MRLRYSQPIRWLNARYFREIKNRRNRWWGDRIPMFGSSKSYCSPGRIRKHGHRKRLVEMYPRFFVNLDMWRGLI